MTWRPAASITQILNEADALAPHRSTASDGIIGDASHKASTSDHNPDSRGIVHAIDLTEDPAGGWDCAKRTEQIRLARDRRVLYVIFDHRWFHGNRGEQWGHTPWKWESYGGPTQTNPHTDHMHVSVEYGETFENDVHPWFTEEDWLDMATKEEVKQLLEEVLDERGLTVQAVKDLKAADQIIRYAIRGKSADARRFAQRDNSLWDLVERIAKGLKV